MSMTTESKIYWSVGLLSAFLIISAFFSPDDPRRKDDLPWHIDHPTADTISVFGLTLGVSSTNDAVLRFREEAEPSLFKAPDGKMIVENYFDQVNLAGLPSKIVLTVDIPEAQLKGMYERGLRMASTGGSKKITMTAEDIATMRTLPINSLTYLPNLRLDDAIFLKRFGQPSLRVRENKTGLVHWLYPQNGLDIAMSNGMKPMLQFVSPKDFDKLVAPLMANGEVLK